MIVMRLTHFFADNCIYACAIPNFCLIHHNWPLLFPEEHESIEWLLHIWAVLILLKTAGNIHTHTKKKRNL